MASGRPLRGRHGNAGEFASILPAGWPQPNLETLHATFADAGIVFPDIHAMLDRSIPITPWSTHGSIS